MLYLDTTYPTVLIYKPRFDGNFVNNIKEFNSYTHFFRNDYFYGDNNEEIIYSIADIASNELELYGFKHDKTKWYMDIIKYNLNNSNGKSNGIGSGLDWHCENDNYDNLITILFYLRKDETLIGGDLLYKDKNDNIKKIIIKSGLMVIMDGNLMHLPEYCSGTGIRSTIIVSFHKQ